MQDNLVGSEPLSWFQNSQVVTASLTLGELLKVEIWLKEKKKSAIYWFSSRILNILNYCNLGLHKRGFPQKYKSSYSITSFLSMGSFMFQHLWGCWAQLWFVPHFISNQSPACWMYLLNEWLMFCLSVYFFFKGTMLFIKWPVYY